MNKQEFKPIDDFESEQLKNIKVETKNILTIKKLKEMKCGIFAKGFSVDNPSDINMCNNGLEWIVIRDGGEYEYVIYIASKKWDWEYVKKLATKMYSENNIKKLMSCSDEA